MGGEALVRDRPVAAVTGASGMVGGRIVEQLLKRGWHVKVLTRSDLFPAENTEVITGDITDSASVDHLVASADAVFHCAAEIHDETKMQAVNVQGTEMVLEAIAKYGTGYYCHLSSTSVYGLQYRGRVTESSEYHPRTVYELSKCDAEELVRTFQGNAKIVILQPAQVISASRPLLLQIGLRNSIRDRLMLRLKGREYSHLVHVDDVVAAAIHFLDSPPVQIESYILSYDDEHSRVADVYRLVRRYRVGEDVGWMVALPESTSHIVRWILSPNSAIHGSVRFSSAKLFDTGFTFPLGLEGSVERICLAGGGER